MFHVKHCIFASAEGERHCKGNGTAGNEPLLHGTAELPQAKPRNIFMHKRVTLCNFTHKIMYGMLLCHKKAIMHKRVTLCNFTHKAPKVHD